jgi:hypothetical protein
MAITKTDSYSSSHPQPHSWDRAAKNLQGEDFANQIDSYTHDAALRKICISGAYLHLWSAGRDNQSGCFALDFA